MSFLQSDWLVRVFEVNTHSFNCQMFVCACLCPNAGLGAAVLHSPLIGTDRPQVPFGKLFGISV